MSVGTISPENCPRDPAELLKLRPSVRFRLMNQLGGLLDQKDKQAYSSATHEEQSQRLAAQLANVPFSGETAPTPGGAPAPTVAAAQPQIPTIPTAAPQTVVAAPAAPAIAAPTTVIAAPTAPTMGLAMPGAPGVVPRQSVQVTTPTVLAAAAPTTETRDPEFQPEDDPLATIIQNQQNMAQSLQSIAESMQHIVSAVDQVKAQATGTNSMSGISLVLLTKFVEAAMQKPRAAIAGEIQAGLAVGELDEFLQAVLGGAQG